MMFSGKLFTIVAAVLAVAVSGSPVDVNPGGVPANSNGSPTKIGEGQPQSQSKTKTVNVSFFNAADLSGQCGALAVELNVCKPVPDGCKGAISSFKHDAGIVCTLFAELECVGDSVDLKAEETPNLGADGINFDKKPLSFKCKAA